MRKLNWLLLLVVFAMIAAACGSDEGEETTTTAGEGGATTTAAESGRVDMAGADFNLFGAPVAAEGDATTGFIDLYNSVYGSSITFTGSDSYETQIQVRVEGGDPPLVTFSPQPAVVCQFAADPGLVSVEDMGFDIAELEATRGKFLMDQMICEDGKHYGIPWYPNFKSIVFYRSDVFESQGYEIPATYEELVGLSSQMVTDGYTPWCFGFESDAASGWPGTDWIEDIMVRMWGADKYSDWISHALTFESPEVKAAFEKFGEIVLAPDFVLGGAENIPATNFRDSPLPMFNVPPDDTCLMLKQGSFVSNYFPETPNDPNAVVKTFPFPTIDGNSGALGGGDTLMVFEDDPQVVQFVEDIISPEWMCAHASATGGTASEYGGHGVEGVEFLPGDSRVDPACYESESYIAFAEAITSALDANTFVFDASDLMPAEVGQGTFWSGMLDYVRGKDLDSILADIDGGWPSG
jgi:alpha-glucoside transport system substrate-binding protein